MPVAERPLSGGRVTLRLASQDDQQIVGAMSVAVTIGANHAHTLDRLLIQLLAAVIGAAIVALAILLTYRYAERFAQRIGREGMNIVLRLSAFIVLSIGVQIAWNGIKVLLQESGVAA